MVDMDLASSVIVGRHGEVLGEQEAAILRLIYISLDL